MTESATKIRKFVHWNTWYLETRFSRLQNTRKYEADMFNTICQFFLNLQLTEVYLKY